MSEDEDEDEDEDEETVHLRLQEIKAKLKLKKLQKARQAAANVQEDGPKPGTGAHVRRVEIARPQSQVEVPMSPMRNRRVVEEPKSPARVLLGIDKGLRAQDVSLKRASSLHSRTGSGGLASLARARANSTRAEAPKEKSFSERIAESRGKVKEQEQKKERIESSRSQGFGLKNIEGLRDGASSRASSSLSCRTRTPSQDTVPTIRTLDKSRLVLDLRNTPSSRPISSLSTRTEGFRGPSAASQASSTALRNATSTSTKYNEIVDRDDSSDAASFESFSGLHLKSRGMQHNTLTRTLEGKTIFTIPQLLKDVKGPFFDPPDIEGDYVILGIIASKSSPLTPKNARREQQAGNDNTDANQSGKFMVIRITDLKWELDLFLFDTGFSQFWKLPIGTLIAVLNPDIMKPRNTDTGKFSLKLGSSDDTVLEIGVARDLDFCHATKKDGKGCEQWIDGRKTEFCDFHIELQIERSKRGRMEVNTMTGFGKGPSGGGGKHGMFGGGGRGRGGDEIRREGKFHDRLLHETVYIAPGAGGAARLMDHDVQSWERGSRAEKHQKRLAEKEKERELAKRLGDTGSGAGGDYMQLKGSGAQNLPARGDFRAYETDAQKEKRRAAMDDPLGLNGKKAQDVSLAPVKRKRMISLKTESFSAPVGWGGASKPGVPGPPRSPTKQSSFFNRTKVPSPMKKKARLLLPNKGIREPGRESLGMDVGLLAAMDDDDDDDLEFI
jgi:minichromosome maintenance protein 10